MIARPSRWIVAVLFTACLSLSPSFHAQQTPVTTAASLCCGSVSAEGKRLDAVIDSMHVEDLWQAHLHIDWETGEQDRPATYTGPDRATHCSSFTAALGKKLNVYLLRPPQHPQQLLASAQARWFHSKDGEKAGWTSVATPTEAQTLANKGELVMVVYESPDPDRPGHIAVIRPFAKTVEDLERDGPQTAQAGAKNFSSGVARTSFAKHREAWPNNVRYYAHLIDWSTLPEKR